MNRTGKSAVTGLAIGALCGLVLTGCAGTASPIGPSAMNQPGGAGLPTINGSLSQRSLGDLSSLAQGQGAENRFLVCYPPDGSFHQLSVHVLGMSGAVQHCLKVMNGRVGGVIRSPVP
jgi:hypothetical protein